MRKKGWLAGYREIGRGAHLILMRRLTRQSGAPSTTWRSPGSEVHPFEETWLKKVEAMDYNIFRCTFKVASLKNQRKLHLRLSI